MKKFFVLLVAILTVLCMTACGQETEKVFVRGDVEFTLNTQDKTISDGENIYEYSIEGSGDNYTIDIRYPDGAVYTWSQSEEVGTGKWKISNESGIVGRTNELVEIAKEDVPKSVGSKPWFLVIVLGVLGLAGLICPYGLWWLGYGWYYKEAKPSESAITVGRAGGGIALFVAVVLAIIFIVK